MRFVERIYDLNLAMTKPKPIPAQNALRKNPTLSLDVLPVDRAETIDGVEKIWAMRDRRGASREKENAKREGMWSGSKETTGTSEPLRT